MPFLPFVPVHLSTLYYIFVISMLCSLITRLVIFNCSHDAPPRRMVFHQDTASHRRLFKFGGTTLCRDTLYLATELPFYVLMYFFGYFASRWAFGTLARRNLSDTSEQAPPRSEDDIRLKKANFLLSVVSFAAHLRDGGIDDRFIDSEKICAQCVASKEIQPHNHVGITRSQMIGSTANCMSTNMANVERSLDIGMTYISDPSTEQNVQQVVREV